MSAASRAAQTRRDHCGIEFAGSKLDACPPRAIVECHQKPPGPREAAMAAFAKSWRRES